jgi:hypothetical protein
MRNWMLFSGVLVALMPSAVAAQSRPADCFDPADPRALRAMREKAVASVGPIARNFVEAWGESAVAAIFACTKPTATKLAQFHAEGKLSRLPRPDLLLGVIGRPKHGDAVALFAMQHYEELIDETRYRVFLNDALTFSLELRSLDAGVAKYSAEVRDAQRRQEEGQQEDIVNQMIVVGVIVVLALTAWGYRERVNQTRL